MTQVVIFFQSNALTSAIEIYNMPDNNLNLLKIFVVVGEELNLTRASKRLHLGQPALSHALKTLREEFRDPLFVRVPHGLAPTERALSLIPKVRDVLALADKLYAEDGKLDLKSVERNIVLATTGYFELRMANGFVPNLFINTAKVSLHTVPLQGSLPKNEMERGDIHLAIAAYFDDLPPSFRIQKLGLDPIVCLVRKGHPYATSQTLKDYLRFPHIKIDVPIGAKSRVDIILEERGLARDIKVFAANFASPPVVVASTDFILTCPRSLAEIYSSWGNVEIAPAPVDAPPIEVKMVWHERFQSDAFHRWFRSQVSVTFS